MYIVEEREVADIRMTDGVLTAYTQSEETLGLSEVMSNGIDDISRT